MPSFARSATLRVAMGAAVDRCRLTVEGLLLNRKWLLFTTTVSFSRIPWNPCQSIKQLLYPVVFFPATSRNAATKLVAAGFTGSLLSIQTSGTSEVPRHQMSCTFNLVWRSHNGLVEVWLQQVTVQLNYNRSHLLNLFSICQIQTRDAKTVVVQGVSSPFAWSSVFDHLYGSITRTWYCNDLGTTILMSNKLQ